MDIEKYKKELEGGIYGGAKDGTFYIGGKVVEKVLKDVINEALRTLDIASQKKHATCDECGGGLYYDHTNNYYVCSECLTTQ